MQQQFAVGQEVSKRDLKRVLPVIIYWKRSYTLSSFRSDHFHHVLFTKERKREFFYFISIIRLGCRLHGHPAYLCLTISIRMEVSAAAAIKKRDRRHWEGGELCVFLTVLDDRGPLISYKGEREKKNVTFFFRFGGRLNGFRICWPTHNTIWHTWPACVCV